MHADAVWEAGAVITSDASSLLGTSESSTVILMCLWPRQRLGRAAKVTRPDVRAGQEAGRRAMHGWDVATTACTEGWHEGRHSSVCVS